MRSAAGLLTLALAGLALPAGAANYLVSGIIVDSQSHAPLGNVRVSLAPAAARDRKLERVTQQDGGFSFAVSEPGKYVLSISKPGYPLQLYKEAGYAPVSSAIVVREGQDTTRLVFEANRGGAITGLIKDEDSEPVANALVAVYQSLVVDGNRKIFLRGQKRTNAVGEFRFANLSRGDYYVCAMGRPWFADSLIQLREIQSIAAQSKAAVRPGGGRTEFEQLEEALQEFSPDPGFRGTAFLTTFYPNAQSIGQASLIRLGVGGEADASIVLPTANAVTVKGAINVPGEIGDGQVNLYSTFGDHRLLFMDAWVQPGKTFEFKNVPPGSYEIDASSQAGSGASSWSVREPLQVGAADMEITLRPQRMGSLAGRVFFEGEHPAPEDSLYVSLRNEKGVVSATEVSPGGTFSLPRLPPGRYEVIGGNADYIASYLKSPDGERLPLSVAISSGENVRRDLTLTRAISVIEGTVENAGVPQIGAFVLLLPKNSSDRWAYRIDQTDSDGSYRLGTIPSGDYFLIALSDGDNVAYRDPKVAARLSQRARPVHVEPGDRLNLNPEVVSTAALNLSSL
ncbi:MAG: carboxypeptidase regulatory-like domain-containing protein [Bryobacteraceae bacterium]